MTAPYIEDPVFRRLPDGAKALRESERFFRGEPLPSRKQQLRPRANKAIRSWQDPRLWLPAGVERGIG